MIFGILEILSQISLAQRLVKLRITISKSLAVFMPDITTNHAVTYIKKSFCEI